MSGVNKVIIVGNVGKDPEIRHTPNGDTVANFSIATSERWTDKKTGEKKENTEWHRLVAWRRQAEVIQEYVRSGSKLYIEGKLQTREWEDKNTGAKRYTTEIIVQNLQMLDSRNQSNSQPSDAPQQAQRAAAPVDDFDDDIPF